MIGKILQELFLSKLQIYFWVVNSSFILESPGFLEATSGSSTHVCSGFLNRNQSRMEQGETTGESMHIDNTELIHRNVALFKRGDKCFIWMKY